MHDLALLHEREREEHLARIRAHGAQVEPDIFAVPLDDLAEIHAVQRGEQMSASDPLCEKIPIADVPERLEDEAEMPAMLECAVQADEVLLVVRIGRRQLAQNLRLLDASLVPVQ